MFAVLDRHSVAYLVIGCSRGRFDARAGFLSDLLLRTGGASMGHWGSTSSLTRVVARTCRRWSQATSPTRTGRELGGGWSVRGSPDQLRTSPRVGGPGGWRPP